MISDSNFNTILTVAQSLPLERLDTFLRAKFPVCLARRHSTAACRRAASRSTGARSNRPIIRAPAKPFPSAGPKPAPDRAQPEDIPLDILHEDDDLLVLNKPPGLVVHPAAGHPEHTLVNALLHHCAGGSAASAAWPARGLFIVLTKIPAAA